MTGVTFTDTALIVTNITSDGTPLAQGDTFVLFAKASGAFAGEVMEFFLPPTPTNLVWDVSHVEIDGSIQVVGLPVVTNQPQSLAVNAGSPATFTVGATGSPTLAYQWLKSGANIGGANGTSYNVASVSANDAGGYSVVVTNPYGSTTSTVATLTVNIPPTNPPPAITGVAMLPDGNLTLSGTGAVSQPYVLLAASNLVPAITWTPRATNAANGNGVFQFLDDQATNFLQRFYRIATP